MEAGIVPVGGAEALLRAAPGPALKPPMALDAADVTARGKAAELVVKVDEMRTRFAVAKATGELECVTGEIIWTPELARTEAKKLAAAGVEATILNFAIWAFPHLPAIATEFAPGPFLCLSNVNPKAPGLVAMLAAAGSLNQVGVLHGRVSGDPEEPKVLRQVMAFLRAAPAVNRLRGKTYGLFGGRSMGMYTAVPALDQWRREFGVDIEHPGIIWSSTSQRQPTGRWSLLSRCSMRGESTG